MSNTNNSPRAPNNASVPLTQLPNMPSPRPPVQREVERDPEAEAESAALDEEYERIRFLEAKQAERKRKKAAEQAAAAAAAANTGNSSGRVLGDSAPPSAGLAPPPVQPYYSPSSSSTATQVQSQQPVSARPTIVIGQRVPSGLPSPPSQVQVTPEPVYVPQQQQMQPQPVPVQQFVQIQQQQQFTPRTQPSLQLQPQQPQQQPISVAYIPQDDGALSVKAPRTDASDQKENYTFPPNSSMVSTNGQSFPSSDKLTPGQYPTEILPSPVSLNSCPRNTTKMFQLEIPEVDGRAYGRNWIWVTPDAIGGGELMYNTPGFWIRLYHAILKILTILKLRSRKVNDPSLNISFESWSSVYAQSLWSVYLSRVDFISLKYAVTKSSALKYEVPTLAVESKAATFLGAVRAQLGEILAWWQQLLIRFLEICFRNDLGFIGVCLVWTIIALICLFNGVGQDGSVQAIYAAFAFIVMLLLLALAGLAWSMEEHLNAASIDYHSSVQRPHFKKIMLCWSVITAFVFVAFICGIVFIGDWQKNGPDVSHTQPVVGTYPQEWSSSEKFMCKNWDSSNKVYKSKDDLVITQADINPDASYTTSQMCSDLERATTIVPILLLIGVFFLEVAIFFLLTRPRAANEFLYAHVTFHGKSQFGFPVRVLLTAPDAQELQMEYLRLVNGRYDKEVSYLYAPTLSEKEFSLKAKLE